MQFVLGSSSPFRQEAFKQVTSEFISLSPNIDEMAIRDADPYRLTLKLANAKADALLPKITQPSILVTGDQVVYFKGQILEKPESVEQARAFMRAYANEYVEAINGMVVVNTATGKRVEGHDVVKTQFKNIPEDIIDLMIEKGGVMLCSGALMTEDPVMDPCVEYQHGSDESLMGVPVELVKNLIAQVS